MATVRQGLKLMEFTKDPWIADVAPTQLAVKSYFVSVDLQRDTSQRISDFLNRHQVPMVGLQPISDAHLLSQMSQFGFPVKPSKHGSDQLIDHGSKLYLIGKNRELLGYFRHPQQPEQLSVILNAMLLGQVDPNLWHGKAS